MSIRPYLGINVNAASVEEMHYRGLFRRNAAILNHRKAGFKSNGMGVWRVDEADVDKYGEQFGQYLPLWTCAHVGEFLAGVGIGLTIDDTLLMVAAIWGSSYALAKQATQQLPVLEFHSLRGGALPRPAAARRRPRALVRCSAAAA